MTSFANAPGRHLQDLILDTHAVATKEQKLACLKMLRTVVKNLSDPKKSNDPKFRQLKLSNPKVEANLTPCPSALEYMKAIGFDIVHDENDGEEYLRMKEEMKIVLSDMEAALCELNNAVDMVSPSPPSSSSSSSSSSSPFGQEKQTSEGNYSTTMLRSQSSTLSSASGASASSSSSVTRKIMSEKQKARLLLEKKRQQEAEEAKKARQRTSKLIKQDKYVRENDENWTSQQSAACVKSGTGINTFRDKYGEN
eukprot:CAMPEP_0171337842 /NCGR_PEP_ID=MMETSP0878-20121228/6936_1 /TAXON_ID=67004 /ORGANISM="Thalassiosira weissflogii, Strain CCMP1336" /LENGTH=252 /DNA_ID=CAMNT_0011839511 /DNA_START=62 /DNA_END=820 /DNA_ORIENTATION=-